MFIFNSFVMQVFYKDHVKITQKSVKASVWLGVLHAALLLKAPCGAHFDFFFSSYVAKWNRTSGVHVAKITTSVHKGGPAL